MTELQNDALVKIKDHIPDIFVELKYATENNFMKKKIYDFKEAYLRYGTLKKLKKAQETVKKEGYSLLVYDAFRPTKAQFVMWEFMPNDDFVADPTRGFSKHSRGMSIDVSLCTADGKKVPMPGEFDEFATAKRDYANCSEEVQKNMALIENAMREAGFRLYVNEWWHYNDEEFYPVIENLDFELE